MVAPFPHFANKLFQSWQSHYLFNHLTPKRDFLCGTKVSALLSRAVIVNYPRYIVRGGELSTHKLLIGGYRE